MAVNQNKLIEKLKKIPYAPDTKIIIVGLSESCMNAAEALHTLGRDVFAYASDDTAFVYNKNKENVIWAEKYVADTESAPIKLYDFYEAIQTDGVFFLLSTDHYRNILLSLGFAENVHFFRINN